MEEVTHSYPFRRRVASAMRGLPGPSLETQVRARPQRWRAGRSKQRGGRGTGQLTPTPGAAPPPELGAEGALPTLQPLQPQRCLVPFPGREDELPQDTPGRAR